MQWATLRSVKSLDSDGGIGQGEGGLTEGGAHTWALGEAQCPHRWRTDGKWHTGESQSAESRLTSLTSTPGSGTVFTGITWELAPRQVPGSQLQGADSQSGRHLEI